MFSKPTLALTLTSNFALWCIWTLRVLGLAGPDYYIFFQSYTEFPREVREPREVRVGTHSMGSEAITPTNGWDPLYTGEKEIWLQVVSNSPTLVTTRPLLTAGSKLIGNVGYPNLTRPDFELDLYDWVGYYHDPNCNGKEHYITYGNVLNWHFNCIPVAQLTLEQIISIADQMLRAAAQIFCDIVDSIKIVGGDGATVSVHGVTPWTRTLFRYFTTEKKGCYKYGYSADNWHDEGRRYLKPIEAHLQGQPDCTSVVASWVFMVNKTTTVDAYSPTACCKMAGVTCEGSKVTKIDWSNKGLKGIIPSFFGQLSDLKYL